MRYLITPEAYSISHTEAVKRGCTGSTVYWWNVIEHPSNGSLAIELPDEELMDGIIDTLPDDWNPQWEPQK